MSGGLTPCRQLRPSSRREHVKASKSYMEWGKKTKTKTRIRNRDQVYQVGEAAQAPPRAQDEGAPAATKPGAGAHGPHGALDEAVSE